MKANRLLLPVRIVVRLDYLILLELRDPDPKLRLNRLANIDAPAVVMRVGRLWDQVLVQNASELHLLIKNLDLFVA